MKELIERIERATGPDSKLDDAIKLAHAGFLIASGKTKDETIERTKGDLYADPRPYTSSVDAALALIPDGMSWSGGNLGEEDQRWACVQAADGRDFACLSAATVALAICAAALKASAQ